MAVFEIVYNNALYFRLESCYNNDVSVKSEDGMRFAALISCFDVESQN